MPRAAAINANQLAMERAETQAVRSVAAAYNQARSELLAELLDGWVASGVMTPQGATEALRRLALLERIDARLLELEREAGAILRGIVLDGEERALDAIRRELAQLPPNITQDLRSFTRINAQMVEEYLPVAIEDTRLATAALRAQLRREIQAGLLQGESFPDLVRRLMRTSTDGEGAPLWRNGQVSAERAARRMVIQAENAARQGYIAQARRGIPELKKQAVAVISNDTTDCCLRVHGQIVDVDQPFELVGTPRFARQMMHSPFHWNCRTAIAAWHPRFEGGGLNTANMTTSAQAELRNRST